MGNFPRSNVLYIFTTGAFLMSTIKKIIIKKKNGWKESSSIPLENPNESPILFFGLMHMYQAQY